MASRDDIIRQSGASYQPVPKVIIPSVATAATATTIAPATTLPASPTDGQQAILVDSTSAPTYAWLCQWNAAAAKWIFLGGSPQSAEVNTAEARNNTAYGDCATVHSLTLVRAGVYEMTYGAQFEVDTAKNNVWFMSPKFSAAEAVDADAATVSNSINGGATMSGSALWTSVRTRRITVAAAAQVVTMRYKQGTASTTNRVQNRFLKVIPVTVT